VAWGYVQLSVFGHVTAKVTAKVAVLIEGIGAKITGGKKTIIKKSTAKEWCDYYGLPIKKGVVVLFKALDDNYKSGHGFLYKPGTVPIAPDWDGGKEECGGGLHFSPHPIMTQEFMPKAKRYMACPVKLSDIVVHPNGSYPQKIKSKGCCGPIWEVDLYGEKKVE
jgi:hypothetical protein